MTSEYLGFLMDTADYNFPLARIDDLRELLETGLLLNAWEPAEEEPTAAATSAAERAATEIVDALIYGVPPKLAAFLGAEQPPEIVEEINGWLPMVTGKTALYEACREAIARPALALVKGGKADNDSD